MIIGECPYEGCGGEIFIPIAENVKLPCMQRHNCEKCGQEIWTQHSRWDPKSWTKESFQETFEVNEDTHEITER